MLFSARSRLWDKGAGGGGGGGGGGGCPLFSALRASVWSKNKKTRGRGGAFPGSATTFAGCSLGIGDRRILRLLRRILRLTFGSLWLLFIQAWRLSKYSPITLHLPLITRILTENPVSFVIRFWPSTQKLEIQVCYPFCKIMKHKWCHANQCLKSDAFCNALASSRDGWWREKGSQFQAFR